MSGGEVRPGTEPVPGLARGLRRLGFDVGLPLLVFLVMTVGLVALMLDSAADGQNEAARENSRKIARSLLGHFEERLARTAQDYAVWDEAVENLHVRFGLEWAQANIGQYVETHFGVDVVAVIDAAGGVRFHHAADGVGLSVGTIASDPALRSMVERARGAWKGPPEQGFIELGGVVYIAAVNALAYFERPDVIPAAERSVLVFLQALNAPFLADLERKFDLPDLRVVTSDPPPSGGAVLPLKNRDGMVVGRLIWNPALPGRLLVQSMAPALVTVLVLLLLIAALVLWRARYLGRQLDETARALTASQERFDLAVRGANDGIFDWDLITDATYLSPRWKEILGYGQHELPEDSNAWRTRVHPDDVDELRQRFRAYLHGEASTYAVECRFLRKDGSYVWVLVRGQLLRDEAGLPRRMVGTITDVSQRKRQEELVFRSAFYDRLTELPNRHMFEERLRQTLDIAAREHKRLALLFLDLDHFKDVNDTMGHGAGDALLVKVAQRIHGAVRPTDTVARLGGDEFTILLAPLGSRDDALIAARRVLASVAGPIEVCDATIHVSASLGIAVFPDDATTAGELIRCADTAMYDAKRSGRNRASIYDRDLDRKVAERVSLEADLRAALDRDEFFLLYQPQFDLRTRRIVAAEALIRWRSPSRGLVLPDAFIPAAEASGLIVEIGERVIDMLARHSLDLARGGLPTLGLSFNLSPLQMRDPARLVRSVEKLRKTAGTERPIEIELTETLSLHGQDDTMWLLHMLSGMGIRLAMDDFGVGYSSIAALRSMPVKVVKIDRTFMADIGVTSGAAEVVRSMVAMAHGFGFEVVAEGVETSEQLSILSEAGCDLAQGYFISRPIPPEEIRSVVDTPFQIERVPL